MKTLHSFDKATTKQLDGQRKVNLTILVDKEMADNALTSRAHIGGWENFSNKMTQTTELDIQSTGEKCVRPIKVFLGSEIKDKLTPVVVATDFTLVEDGSTVRH